MFTAWAGETLGVYLRRRRLEVSALRLLTQPTAPVLQIALTVGFGSGEAFARAFKEHFGCTPSGWRRQHVEARQAQIRKLDQPLRKMDQDAPVDGATRLREWRPCRSGSSSSPRLPSR